MFYYISSNWFQILEKNQFRLKEICLLQLQYSRGLNLVRDFLRKMHEYEVNWLIPKLREKNERSVPDRHYSAAQGMTMNNTLQNYIVMYYLPMMFTCFKGYMPCYLDFIQQSKLVAENCWRKDINGPDL